MLQNYLIKAYNLSILPTIATALSLNLHNLFIEVNQSLNENKYLCKLIYLIIA